MCSDSLICRARRYLSNPRVLRTANKRPEQIILIGSKYDVMKEAKKRFPELAVLWLVSPDKDDPTMPKVEQLIARAKEAGFDGLNLNCKFPIDAEFVQAVTAAKLQLYVWTVDDPVVARKLVNAGVHGIATNRPEWLRGQL